MNEEEKEFEYLRQTSQLIAEFIDFKHVIGDEIDRIHYKMDRQARDIVELRMDVSRIEKKMDDKFYGVDRRLDGMDKRLDEVLALLKKTPPE